MFDIVRIILIIFSFFGNNTQDKDNESLDNANTGLLAHNLIPNISNNNQSGNQPHNSLFFVQQNQNKTNGLMSSSIEKKDETSIKKNIEIQSSSNNVNSGSYSKEQSSNTQNPKDYMKEIISEIEMMNVQQKEEIPPENPITNNTNSNNTITNINPGSTKTPSSQPENFADYNYEISFPYGQPPFRGQPSQIENDLIENCATLCKEQAGCRLLQKKIDECPSVASEIIYPKILNIIIELSCDQFGNYFIQKVIEYLSPAHIEDFLKNKITPNFAPMCFNQHGTRVIQKVFEKIISIDYLLKYYTKLLIPNLKAFIVDPNATHIIIKYVSLVQSPGNDFIIEFLSKNVYEIATQKHSCCSLQKCIEFANPVQKHYLLLAIANVSYGLFTDQFGNYVVQFAINACDFEINHIIVVNFLKDFKRFSSQKYSSNVIEKSLDCCDDHTKQLIVEKLCDYNLVYSLLFDMYGNYVLQKTMMLAKEPYRTRFFELVGPIMDNVKVLPFGQKLYNKLLATFPELFIYIKNDGSSNMVNGNGYKKKNQKNKKMNNNNQKNMLMGNPPNLMMMNKQQGMMNNMNNLDPSNYQINSFQNYGNVYYQNNQYFPNPYQFNTQAKNNQPFMNPNQTFMGQPNPSMYNNFMNKYYN